MYSKSMDFHFRFILVIIYENKETLSFQIFRDSTISRKVYMIDIET